MTNISSYQRQNQYYYQRTVYNTSGADGTSGTSGAGGTSGISGISGVTIETVTVEKLTFEEIKDLFTKGNLTAGEIEKWLDSKKITYMKIQGATDMSGKMHPNGDRILTYAFRYNNINYEIACNEAAANSQLDNNKAEQFTLSTLKNNYKLDDATIEKYFYVSVKENGNSKYYSITPSSPYKNLNQIRSAIFTDYKNNLVLNNYVNGLNIRTNSKGIATETKENLYKTSNGTTLSEWNYTNYKNEISVATPEKANELRQEALDKFVDEFGSGNLAYTQVSTILDAIGVEHKSIRQEGENYNVSFTYQGKDYFISCNKEAAKSGVDDIIVEKNDTFDYEKYLENANKIEEDFYNNSDLYKDYNNSMNNLFMNDSIDSMLNMLNRYETYIGDNIFDITTDFTDTLNGQEKMIQAGMLAKLGVNNTYDLISQLAEGKLFDSNKDSLKVALALCDFNPDMKEYLEKVLNAQGGELNKLKSDFNNGSWQKTELQFIANSRYTNDSKINSQYVNNVEVDFILEYGTSSEISERQDYFNDYIVTKYGDIPGDFDVSNNIMKLASKWVNSNATGNMDKANSFLQATEILTALAQKAEKLGITSGTEISQFMAANYENYMNIKSYNPEISFDELYDYMAYSSVSDNIATQLDSLIEDAFGGEYSESDAIRDADIDPARRYAYVMAEVGANILASGQEVLTKGEYYNNIKTILTNVFPGYENMSAANKTALSKQIGSLNPTEIMQVLNSILKLPTSDSSSYANALNDFKSEFNSLVQGRSEYKVQNPDEKVSINETFKNFYGVEYSPDNINTLSFANTKYAARLQTEVISNAVVDTLNNTRNVDIECKRSEYDALAEAIESGAINPDNYEDGTKLYFANGELTTTPIQGTDDDPIVTTNLLENEIINIMSYLSGSVDPTVLSDMLTVMTGYPNVSCDIAHIYIDTEKGGAKSLDDIKNKLAEFYQSQLDSGVSAEDLYKDVLDKQAVAYGADSMINGMAAALPADTSHETNTRAPQLKMANGNPPGHKGFFSGMRESFDNAVGYGMQAYGSVIEQYDAFGIVDKYNKINTSVKNSGWFGSMVSEILETTCPINFVLGTQSDCVKARHEYVETGSVSHETIYSAENRVAWTVINLATMGAGEYLQGTKLGVQIVGKFGNYGMQVAKSQVFTGLDMLRQIAMDGEFNTTEHTMNAGLGFILPWGGNKIQEGLRKVLTKVPLQKLMASMPGFTDETIQKMFSEYTAEILEYEAMDNFNSATSAKKQEIISKLINKYKLFDGYKLITKDGVALGGYYIDKNKTLIGSKDLESIFTEMQEKLLGALQGDFSRLRNCIDYAPTQDGAVWGEIRNEILGAYEKETSFLRECMEETLGADLVINYDTLFDEIMMRVEETVNKHGGFVNSMYNSSKMAMVLDLLRTLNRETSDVAEKNLIEKLISKFLSSSAGLSVLALFVHAEDINARTTERNDAIRSQANTIRAGEDVKKIRQKDTKNDGKEYYVRSSNDGKIYITDNKGNVYKATTDSNGDVWYDPVGKVNSLFINNPTSAVLFDGTMIEFNKDRYINSKQDPSKYGAPSYAKALAKATPIYIYNASTLNDLPFVLLDGYIYNPTTGEVVGAAVSSPDQTTAVINGEIMEIGYYALGNQDVVITPDSSSSEPGGSNPYGDMAGYGTGDAAGVIGTPGVDTSSMTQEEYARYVQQKQIDEYKDRGYSDQEALALLRGYSAEDIEYMRKVAESSGAPEYVSNLLLNQKDSDTAMILANATANGYINYEYGSDGGGTIVPQNLQGLIALYQAGAREVNGESLSHIIYELEKIKKENTVVLYADAETKQENYNEMMNYFENMMSFLGWDEMDHNASFDGWLESQGLA